MPADCTPAHVRTGARREDVEIRRFSPTGKFHFLELRRVHGETHVGFEFSSELPSRFLSTRLPGSVDAAAFQRHRTRVTRNSGQTAEVCTWVSIWRTARWFLRRNEKGSPLRPRIEKDRGNFQTASVQYTWIVELFWRMFSQVTSSNKINR